MDTVLLRRLQGIALRSVPPHVIVLTALASYAAQILAILQGWPLWAIVLVTLLPWVPLFSFELVWTYRHYHWLALFYLLVVTQTGHVFEHVAQVVQIHLLGLRGADARGIFGALDIEWVHFVWNTWVLLAVALLLVRFRRNPWLWATAALAGWHEVEHLSIMAVYLGTGKAGTPGLLAQGGALGGGLPLLRPDLHFAYNLIETAPLLAAFAYQLKHTYDEWLARALPHVPEPALVEATDRLRPLQFAAGEAIVRQGEPADRFYVITRGRVRVTCRDATGREAELGSIGPGQYFGEIGLLSQGPRTATVIAATPVDVLALNRAAFVHLLESSEAAAADVARVARERLATHTHAHAPTGAAGGSPRPALLTAPEALE